MNLASRFRDGFADRLDAMLADIAELVGIEAGSYDVEGVTRTSHWIGERLHAQGLNFITKRFPSAAIACWRFEKGRARAD
ncbi:M20 family metallopeptidase [Ochrobactrum tritici]|uniref:M20 family metallopeptidase n=1 Tax=Brucella tritici TaxID=94626 RepID=A0A7X6FUR9_9HYPH|nr:M20 family metallopeptidase [Brucella tritici]